MSTTTTIQLDCRLSVNDVIARHPATTATFNAHGIDTCCGGAASVEDAARAAGLDPVKLCGELLEAIEGAR
jgi:iron-sulfur cluster repair protein YtfE (RIC family)